MYVDGHLTGKYGETHKVSALETLQFSATGIVDDIKKCVTMDSKIPGDLVYILGETRNELGGSAYYALHGYVGLRVPRVYPRRFLKLYQALAQAIQEELVASAHGIYRGGLGSHLALVAMGGCQGMQIDLRAMPTNEVARNDSLLFSESAGRFIVTLDPGHKSRFEALFNELPCVCIGSVTEQPLIKINGISGERIFSRKISDLKKAWKAPFGAFI
jgi:phosphoribosylformylglycinamidine synthase